MLDALGTDLTAVVAEQPDPLLFATVSGAHLYGFPSRDSDVDLRGAHLLPAAELLALAIRRRPAAGCGSGTAQRWTWSPTTCASSSG